jgi:hypothetical protein
MLLAVKPRMVCGLAVISTDRGEERMRKPSLEDGKKAVKSVV